MGELMNAVFDYATLGSDGFELGRKVVDLSQPFAQGDSTRSRDHGSGLGLSICKRVGDMHGFDLSISQPYGRFTKAFVLQCPLRE